MLEAILVPTLTNYQHSLAKVAQKDVLASGKTFARFFRCRRTLESILVPNLTNYQRSLAKVAQKDVLASGKNLRKAFPLLKNA